MYRRWVAVALLLCVCCAEQVPRTAWERASLGMSRLRDTFRKSADDIRRGEGLTPSSSVSEKMAFLYDYVSDTLAQPPMLSVEKNLVTIFKNQRRLTRTIRRLHKKLYELSLACNSAVVESAACIDPAFAGDPSHDSCNEVLGTKLVPVQGMRYTVIGNRTS
jgi:hypothetical protein